MAWSYMQKALKIPQNNLDLINKFTMVTGDRVSIQAPVAFLYASIKLSEKDSEKSVPFTVGSKGIKCPVTFSYVFWASFLTFLGLGWSEQPAGWL